MLPLLRSPVYARRLMHIPPFSLFSAVSELFVTAGVVFVVKRNWDRKPFPFGVFLTVALFEAFVNVFYMAHRASQAASGRDSLSPALKLGFALHGMLSLLAYLVFVVLAVLAYQEQKSGRFLFREHVTVTVTFLVIWVVSIGSGEVMFAVRYLG